MHALTCRALVGEQLRGQQSLEKSEGMSPPSQGLQILVPPWAGFGSPQILPPLTPACSSTFVVLSLGLSKGPMPPVPTDAKQVLK